MEFVKFITVLASIVFTLISMALVAVGVIYWNLTPEERQGSEFSFSVAGQAAYLLSFAWIVSRYV